MTMRLFKIVGILTVLCLRYFSLFHILFCGSDFHHSVFQVTYLFFCLRYSATDSFKCIVHLCSLLLLGLWKTFIASSPFFFSEIQNHLHYQYSEYFCWKIAYLHFIYLFFWGFILFLHLGHNPMPSHLY